MKISKRRSNKYIPPEILTLILAKLPAKTLLRFTCVCKSWCSLINRSDFILMHLKLCENNKSNSGKLLTLETSCDNQYEGCLLSMLTLRQADTFQKQTEIFKATEKFELHGTCNSLLLISRNQSFRYKGMRLYNPSVKKSLLLPPFLLPVVYYGYTPIFVLGFATRCDDFKVIAISFEKIKGVKVPEIHVAVYTLSDQQWTVRDNNVLKIDYWLIKRLFGPYYYCEGTAHWLGNAPDGDTSNEFYYPTHLVSLDFDSEQFTFLELPELDCMYFNTSGSLFLLGESLAFFCISPINSFRIWVLKQENGKRLWTLWFSGRSSYDGNGLFYCMDTRLLRVLYFAGDGGYLLYRNNSYNIVTGQVQELGKCMSHNFYMATYSESLVLCNQSGLRSRGYIWHNSHLLFVNNRS